MEAAINTSAIRPDENDCQPNRGWFMLVNQTTDFMELRRSYPLRSTMFKVTLCVSVSCVVVLLIVIGINTFGIRSSSAPSKELRAAGELALLNNCLNNYCHDFDPNYTNDQQLVSALTGNNTRKQVYLASWGLPQNFHGLFVDPWGEPFIYRREGESIVASTRRKLPYPEEWTR